MKNKTESYLTKYKPRTKYKPSPIYMTDNSKMSWKEEFIILSAILGIIGGLVGIIIIVHHFY